MFTKENFQKEWLQEKVNEIKKRKVKADPLLIEKSVHALYLLELLSKSSFEFMFKGGTALILLLEEPTRFSIDIDILMELKYDNEKLHDELEKFVSESGPFLKIEEHIRKDKGIPKRHFKFYYDSKQEMKHLHYILLDILFEEVPYTDTVWLPVKNNLVSTVDPYQKVHLPSIPSILGDKLTAFAPNTVGIPYGVEKETEIAKQMFDVATLSEKIVPSDLQIVKENFIKCAEQNIAFRKLDDTTPDDVLNDLIRTSIILLMNGKVETEKFNELQKGVSRLKGYIFKEKYNYDKAVRDSGKAAHIAIALLHPEYEIEQFNNQNKTFGNIDNKYQKRINVLKKIDKEAHYYWSSVLSQL